MCFFRRCPVCISKSDWHRLLWFDNFHIARDQQIWISCPAILPKHSAKKTNQHVCRDTKLFEIVRKFSGEVFGSEPVNLPALAVERNLNIPWIGFPILRYRNYCFYLHFQYKKVPHKFEKLHKKRTNALFVIWILFLPQPRQHRLLAITGKASNFLERQIRMITRRDARNIAGFWKFGDVLAVWAAYALGLNGNHLFKHKKPP